jgi:hypothetical protein
MDISRLSLAVVNLESLVTCLYVWRHLKCTTWCVTTLYITSYHLLLKQTPHRLVLNLYMISRGRDRGSGKRYFSFAKCSAQLWGIPSLLSNGYWGLFSLG